MLYPQKLLNIQRGKAGVDGVFFSEDLSLLRVSAVYYVAAGWMRHETRADEGVVE